MSLAAKIEPRPSRPAAKGEVLLGEDWIEASLDEADHEMQEKRGRRNVLALKRSPLARRIITFNLLALIVLVTGILYTNPFRESLVLQREQSLANSAAMVADVIELRAADSGAAGLAEMGRILPMVSPPDGAKIMVFDAGGVLVGGVVGKPLPAPADTGFFTRILSGVWGALDWMFGQGDTAKGRSAEDMAVGLLPATMKSGGQSLTGRNPEGNTVFAATAPILHQGRAIGAVAIVSAAGEIDALLRAEREQVLQMFMIATAVSIGLSLVLASTIANPLADLAAAAEIGRDRHAKKTARGRVRIPDLSARPDEIGRLSVAMRGMVSALYDRIDANEQFAADVAHEIKNPLASLRSAVGSLRFVKKEEQREKLLDVIEHDVRRLDRLVSDISNASRLDSELVKEEEEEFDLLHTISSLTEYLGQQARSKGIDFITDLPAGQIVTHGLEARLAQVFVNLITNAISFCEDGDAVRVWARQRENRVLIVVEDTGPGIPDQALQKVFKRFYSERPVGQFGNHSGLGLAISKQIVEAHGGVIWAENIRPTDADITSEPLGARFVVGLPV